MKRYLTGAALLVVLYYSFLFSQGDPGELESRLKGSSGKKRVGILVELMEVYVSKEPKKALKYGEEALEILTAFKDPKQRVALLNQISRANLRLGEFQISETYALQSRDIAREIHDKNGEVDALINLARVNLGKGHYTRALPFLSRAGKLCRKTDYPKGLAEIYQQTGIIYWRLTDYQLALAYIIKATDIYGEIHDLQGIAVSERITAIIYSALEQHQKALEHNIRAIEYFKKLDDKNGLGKTLSNTGNVYRRLGNYAEALKYLNQSLEIFRKMETKQPYSYVLNNIGEVYDKMKDYRQARYYFARSLEIKEKLKDQMGIAFTLINIGRSFRNQEKYKEALQPLQRALAISTEIDVKSMIRDANKELSEVFKGQKNYSRALDYHEKFKEVNDSIIDEQKSKQIVEFQIRYETTRKENEIALLKKDKQIQQLKLAKQKDFQDLLIIVSILVLMLAFVVYTRYRLKVRVTKALKKEMEDRKKAQAELIKSQKLESVGILAGGIAHDFNNLLSVIIGNISMAIDEVEDNPGTAARKLKAAEKSSLQASDLAQKLTTFSQGGWLILQKVTLADILKSTMEHQPEMQSLSPVISIPGDLKPLYGDERQLRQVIYNILKNADEVVTAGPKQVTITARNVTIGKKNDFSLEKGDYVYVSFTDNGRGIPREQLEKIFVPYFSTKDDVTRKGMGLGLSICYSIIKKHNGHITVDSEEGKGTTVRLYLPAYKEEGNS